MKDAKSLKLNTIANFSGVVYTTIIGIVVFPLYLQYVGAEAFGLIGFFIVLMSWMALLNMGMSPMLSRQVAQARGGEIGFVELRRLLRSLEIIAFFLALTVCLSIYTSSGWLASDWLNVTSLDLIQVESSIAIMGAMAGLSFFSSLYRSAIQGMENQVSLNIANVILMSLRFLGALLLLQFITQDILIFFIYQLFVSIIELITFSVMFYRSMPVTEKVAIRFFWGNTLKPVLPFAGGIAYSAGIWVLLTQLDRIILSNILPLSEYGYFSLVAIIATGILIISSPVSQAILPRLTYLLSQGKELDMLVLYKNSTQLMAVFMLPLSGMIALFSTELIFAWTGDKAAAEWGAPVLFWFAIGNGILSISAFQYYLQFAHGKLKMHVIYNTISAVIQIPTIVYVAYEYGALGIAFTWFAFRLVTFIIWTPIVHSKFAPGIHWSWLFKDVAPVFVSTVLGLLFVAFMDVKFERDSRLEIFVILAIIGLSILAINIFVSTFTRKMLLAIVHSRVRQIIG